jgi:hypothetical protein
MTQTAPNRSGSTQASSQGRLTPDEVAHYRREGYVVFDRPVLAESRYQGLKSYFEGILGALPAGERPEAMDVPHFMHPKLLEWAFDPAVLALVEPIVGPDIALFSTHFICKPKGNGKRVPWHEDSAYWNGMIQPMEVCTVWFAIDPSTKVNGCMMVIPRTHVEGQAGFSDYADVDTARNVFSTEIVQRQRDESKRVHVELQANQCSLHDARIMHGSDANTSDIRRCGWTMRFTSSAVKFNQERFAGMHQVYLAKGRDLGGNTYADPTKAYPDVLKRRGESGKYKHSH